MSTTDSERIAETVLSQFANIPKLIRKGEIHESVTHHVENDQFIVKEAVEDFRSLIDRKRWLGSSIIMRLVCERTIEFGWLVGDPEVNAARLALRSANANIKYADAALKLRETHREDIGSLQFLRNENIELKKALLAKYERVKEPPSLLDMSRKAIADSKNLEWLYTLVYRQYSSSTHMNPQNFFWPFRNQV